VLFAHWRLRKALLIEGKQHPDVPHRKLSASTAIAVSVIASSILYRANSSAAQRLGANAGGGAAAAACCTALIAAQLRDSELMLEEEEQLPPHAAALNAALSSELGNNVNDDVSSVCDGIDAQTLSDSRSVLSRLRA